MVSYQSTTPNSKRKYADSSDEQGTSTLKKAKYHCQLKNRKYKEIDNLLPSKIEREFSPKCPSNDPTNLCLNSCEKSAIDHDSCETSNENGSQKSSISRRPDLDKLNKCILCTIGKCNIHRTEEQKATEITRKLKMETRIRHRQNQHLAKAVVDNAINRTLEELGINASSDAHKCEHIVNHGISQAILTQGLECISSKNDTSIVESNDSFAISSSALDTECNSFEEKTCESNNDLIECAVSMVISSKGLKRIEKNEVEF